MWRLNRANISGLICGAISWLILHYFLPIPYLVVPLGSLSGLAIIAYFVAPMFFILAVVIAMVNAFTGRPLLSKRADDFIYGFTVAFDAFTIGSGARVAYSP